MKPIFGLGRPDANPGESGSDPAALDQINAEDFSLAFRINAIWPKGESPVSDGLTRLRTELQCASLWITLVRAQNTDRRPRLRLLDPVRDNPSLFTANVEKAADRRHCAMAASGSLADPTARPHRYDGVRVVDIETGSINHLPRMPDLASKHHGDRSGHTAAAMEAWADRRLPILLDDCRSLRKRLLVRCGSPC